MNREDEEAMKKTLGDEGWLRWKEWMETTRDVEAKGAWEPKRIKGGSLIRGKANEVVPTFRARLEDDVRSFTPRGLSGAEARKKANEWLDETRKELDAAERGPFGAELYKACPWTTIGLAGRRWTESWMERLPFGALNERDIDGLTADAGLLALKLGMASHLAGDETGGGEMLDKALERGWQPNREEIKGKGDSYLWAQRMSTSKKGLLKGLAAGCDPRIEMEGEKGDMPMWALFREMAKEAWTEGEVREKLMEMASEMERWGDFLTLRDVVTKKDEKMKRARL